MANIPIFSYVYLYAILYTAKVLIVQPYIHERYYYFKCRYILVMPFCSLPPNASALDVMKEWHVAFHGTRAECVEKILNTGHLLKPGKLLSD